MSKYTAELRTIVDNGFDIFDFDYTRKPESQAIVSDEDLQQGFIDHYYFREVGFETLQRFKHKLKTQWKESLGEFDNLLIAYNESINVKANIGSANDSTTTVKGNNETMEHNAKVTIENDTPKNALDYGEEGKHASRIVNEKSDNTITNDNSSENKNTQKSTGYAGITEIELLELYHNNIRDIQTEFYKSFDNLFMQIF